MAKTGNTLDTYNMVHDNVVSTVHSVRGPDKEEDQGHEGVERTAGKERPVLSDMESEGHALEVEYVVHEHETQKGEMAVALHEEQHRCCGDRSEAHVNDQCSSR